MPLQRAETIASQLPTPAPDFDQMRRRIHDPTHALLFDDAVACHDAGAYRAAFIFTWTTIAEVLVVTLRSIGHLDRGMAEFVRRFEQDQLAGRTDEAGLVETAAAAGFLDAAHRRQLDAVRARRHHFHHPTAEPPSAAESAWALAVAVDALLSKAPPLPSGVSELARRPRPSPVDAHDTVRVLIASPHPVVREGLTELLEAVGQQIEPVGTADGDDVIDRLGALRPDVTLLDVRLCDQPPPAPTLTRRIRDRFPRARLLALSSRPDGPEIRRVIDDGAEGVVMKTVAPPALLHAIMEVASGRRVTRLPARDGADADRLSGRETEVLECVARGMTNAEIALGLYISVSTVKAHVEHILLKLGASDRASAVAKSFRLHLIQ